MQVLNWTFSQPFASYYTTTAPTLGKPVVFRHATDQFADYHGVDRRYGRHEISPAGELVIYIQPDLPKDLAEVVAAYELTRHQLTLEGFPAARPNDWAQQSPNREAWHALAERLQMALQDPIVDHRLDDAGLNVALLLADSYYRTIQRLEQASFHEHPGTDFAIADALLWVSFFLRKLPDPLFIKLEELAKRKAPETYQRAGDLMMLIVSLKSSMDTPASNFAAMAAIRDALQLRGVEVTH